MPCMLNGLKVSVVMPAYNAEATLEQTHREIPMEIVDAVLLVDDGSSDRTVEVAQRLGLRHFVHPRNRGYGANQKTCYSAALEEGADIVVMLHPDYQYSPRLIPAMVSMIAFGTYDAVIASRILGDGARQGGMPTYKYVSNRVLTLVQNLLCGRKFSEYHTGYRAYSRTVLETVRFQENADGFVFDNQFFMQMIAAGFRIGEVSCPTRYFPEASSIRFWASVQYGFGCLREAARCFLHRKNLWRSRLLIPRAES